MSGSEEYQHSKRGYRVHRVRRSVRALIGPKKKDTTLERQRDSRYYGHVWVSRELHQTISFLSRANKCSMKDVVEQTLKAGLSVILGNAIRESNRQDAALREQGLPAKPTPMGRELARWAKAKGFNIKDVF
jgi:hypothetical protein